MQLFKKIILFIIFAAIFYFFYKAVYIRWLSYKEVSNRKIESYSYLFKSAFIRNSVIVNTFENRNKNVITFFNIKNRYYLLLWEMDEFKNINMCDIKFGFLSKYTRFKNVAFEEIITNNMQIDATSGFSSQENLIVNFDERDNINFRYQNNNFLYFGLKTRCITLLTSNEKPIARLVRKKHHTDSEFMLLKNNKKFLLLFLYPIKSSEKNAHFLLKFLKQNNDSTKNISIDY